VGAGIPGTIDPDAGICIGSANLRWYDVHVAGHLEQLLDMRVRIDNDVRMYVLGESKFGAGRRYRSVFGITLGTGVCGAFAEAGQLYYGSHKLAGEIGHIPIDGETSPCGCGKIGCLETIASATGLTARARQAIAEGYNSVLTQLAPDLKSLTSEHLSLAYDRGDQLAIETMHHAGRTLGKVLSYAVICYDPEVIVVGGGVARAGDRILAAARQEMAERVLRRQRAVDIIVAQLGDDAGVIGSAFHARSLPR
jgi:glucokinase